MIGVPTAPCPYGQGIRNPYPVLGFLGLVVTALWCLSPPCHLCSDKGLTRHWQASLCISHPVQSPDFFRGAFLVSAKQMCSFSRGINCNKMGRAVPCKGQCNYGRNCKQGAISNISIIEYYFLSLGRCMWVGGGNLSYSNHQGVFPAVLRLFI